MDVLNKDKLKIQKDVEDKKTSSQSTDDLKTPDDILH